MRIQTCSRGLFFAAVLFSFMAGADARTPFAPKEAPFGDPGQDLVPHPGSALLADSSALPDSAFAAFSLAKDYSPETDTALRREMRPGESPLQALNRLAGKEKTTRIVLGSSMLAVGPVLIVGGFLGQAIEEISTDGGPFPEMALTLGLVSVGTGIYILASPWSAERRWKRARENILLGIRPDGRGVRLLVRF